MPGDKTFGFLQVYLLNCIFIIFDLFNSNTFSLLNLGNKQTDLFVTEETEHSLGKKSSCLYERLFYLLGFIFSNYSSFVNSSLFLILCGDDVYICKSKKNKVRCHAVADKVLVSWLQ